MSTMKSQPIYVVYVRSVNYGFVIQYHPFLDVDEAHKECSRMTKHYSGPNLKEWMGDTYTVGIETWSVAV